MYIPTVKVTSSYCIHSLFAAAWNLFKATPPSHSSVSNFCIGGYDVLVTVLGLKSRTTLGRSTSWSGLNITACIILVSEQPTRVTPYKLGDRYP